MLEDRILVWKFKQGSPDALQQIYEKYRGTMLTLATALCNDVSAAEDVVQDCFISFARSGKRLRLEGSLKGYLTTSVVNRVRDRLRAGKHRPHPLENPDIYPGREENPAAEAMYNEQMQLLAKALVQIPPEQREAVILHTRGKMTFREIAQMQGVSISTAQKRYEYGIEKLRVILNGEI